MKKVKVIFLVVLIIVLGLFCLTGCSNDKDKETTITSVSSTKKTKSEEEIKANIEKEVLGITKNGDYAIKLQNKNDSQVYIEDVSVRFFDKDGNFVKKENTDDSYFCIPANSEIVTYIWGYEQNFAEYSNSEIEIMLGKPFYKYYTENFEIKANDTDKEIAITITNNNDSELDCIAINVVFFKEGKIVGIDHGISYDEGIKANGGVAYINVDYPEDNNNEEVSFDEFKVYLTSAYKE